MDCVKVISATVQEFLGERFYLCGEYYQHNGKRLHRAVWEHSDGPIPSGHHVHHKDGDKGNNWPDNLALVPGREHISGHATAERSNETVHKGMQAAQQVAREWHGSEAGAEWHSAHAKTFWGNVEPKKYTCPVCGKTFYSRDLRKLDKRFCGQNCRLKYNRRRKAAMA